MLFTEFNMDDLLRVNARENLERGREQTRYQIAANLLGIIDDETIAEKTGLTIKEVEGLRLLPS